MNTRLNELRDQVAAIDREIVAALAVRSRSGARAPASSSDASDLITPAIRAEYAQLVARKICTRPAAASETAACEAADAVLLEAVRNRLRVAREIARAKAAGQHPRFCALVEARDAVALESAITQRDVEEQVIARAVTAARELPPQDLSITFADTVAGVFRDWLIPLARRIQVEVLLGKAEG
ncbi:MAG: hypothetical protein WCR06_06240 [bacterium]